MAKTIQELSLDTQTIERLLQALPIDGFIAYRDLSAAIGRDVQHGARGNLESARRRLLRTTQILFGVVVNEGLKRLDDIGKVETGRAHVRRAHSHAKMARRKTASVDDFDRLPNAVKVEHNIIMAQAGVIQQMSSERTTRKLESTAPPAPMSLEATVALMKATM